MEVPIHLVIKKQTSKQSQINWTKFFKLKTL